ncbi:glucose dehydrogenase [FAD, quinone]-like [Uranotaenia lowii]|uniref:glucose dehydrogenase [FAD, quinone]-like n=1 Tax=Uranotaenia lowii TaxID=190385 RepID=UPI002478599A|nr:glucose dehydrogenase [FAD, quinone]-like [Uranotaenia lowii]
MTHNRTLMNPTMALWRTKYDWQYTAERSNLSSLSLVNGAYLPRGKMLGGSSGINQMAYVRGNRRDYDQLERLGIEGWSWDEVLPYFIKSENNRADEVLNAYGGGYHGVGGYQSVNFKPESVPYDLMLMTAYKEAGYKQLIDFNAVEHIGYGRFQYTIEGATRASSAKAFLNPVKHRKNLHVIKNAFVTSLHFDSTDKVRGVNMVVQDKYEMRALAKKEVVLSAGAFNTPQILMLSGIGRSEQLDELNIPNKAELSLPGFQDSLWHTEYDWQYTAERSNVSSLSIVDGAYLPRGKMLGGSSSMNQMFYVRGNSRDYDQWEQLGNEGWSWDDVLPYFIKSENNKAPEVVNAYGGKYHGEEGYQSVDFMPESLPYDSILIEAYQEAGFKRLIDFNAVEHIGYGWMQYTIEGATRASSAKSFLNPVKHRENLHVIKNAFVTSLHYDSNNTVRGVNMIVQQKFEMLVLAKKEVILSAGAINTPHILMLSGIGRSEQLDKLNIPLKKELNVGNNLQDHVYIPLFFGLDRSISNDEDLSSRTLINLFDYTFFNRSQLIVMDKIRNVMGFANTKSKVEKFPDVQYFSLFFAKGDLTALQFFEIHKYESYITESMRNYVEKQDVAGVLIAGLTPKSRGSLKIVSTNPYDHLALETGFFSASEDIVPIIKGIRDQQRLFNTPTFKRYQANIIKLDIPDCDLITFDTDQYWECYVRHMSTTTYHPSGTAKMSPRSDPDAVVDSQLRVQGIRGLRVIDASIFPLIPSGNTHAPTMMVAEKGSDMIKQFYI